ncbi:MAG: CbtA family protein [Pseudomonadales bacterium]|nr:CbtA family protein [Pseudomonadales bacterium]NRA15967.1 CbtA family protein [Oceanospirillaceae bacterium]
MTLRNLILSALMVGVISGLCYGLFQQLQVNPLIYAAEVYEVAEPAAATASDGHSHDHGEAWGPEDGMPRMAFTLGSNITIAFALALIMISLMALHNQKSLKPKLNALSGAAWGIVAMFCFFVAPAMLGLHPEVPGTNAAELESRQIWWLFCALASALGIAVVYYGSVLLKAVGGLIVAAPHLIGAPLPTEHGFANTDPVAVQALTELTSQFYMMTAIGMLILFIIMGVLSGLSLKKFVHNGA